MLLRCIAGAVALALLFISPAVISEDAKPAPETKAGELRVPAGCRAKDGTTAEPYSKTGWAKEIVHEKTGIEMVFIPAGEFVMGSPEDEKDRKGDEPQHRVRITKPFYLGRYEVTQGEWMKVVRYNRGEHRGSDRLPADSLEWGDCLEFTRLAGGGLRLPTEAEWEYACRAGAKTVYCFGDDEASLDDYAWFNLNSNSRPHEVGLKKPNTWGLYDMHGNVWEWCADRYGPYQFRDGEVVDDPKGPKTGRTWVRRGGAWYFNASNCRCANRSGAVPHDRIEYFGFRVALTCQ
jgi:formylglycine-generating enzyme required for sulfatase activity